MAATNHAQNIKKDSQAYLTTALLQLLETQNFKDITVTQVVKRAGVSRMAFYRNFETLDDVLKAYFAPQIAARFADIDQLVIESEKLQAMGNFFSSFAEPLKLAQKHGFEYIIQEIFSDNIARFYQTTSLTNSLSATQSKYWSRFMAAGVYAIWREWLLGGQTESLLEIHQLLAAFHEGTLTSLLHH